MFSGEPESELTCNASGTRKRTRDGVPCKSHHLELLHQQQHLLREVFQGNVDGTGAGTPAGLHLPYGTSWMNVSALTSATGRAPAGPSVPAAAASPATPSRTQEILSQFHHQYCLDVDALFRLQSERLRSRLDEMQKRHCRALLAAMEQGALSHLRLRAAELDSAKRRNAELEEKVRQMAAENEIWFNIARNNEATVSSLRACLEQAVFLQHVTAAGVITPPELEEGYGDSDGVVPALRGEGEESWFDEGAPATEAETKSTSGTTAGVREGPRNRRWGQGACKACWEGEASVVVLPCRHLCLCEQCEPGVAACPVCKVVMNATLHVSGS